MQQAQLRGYRSFSTSVTIDPFPDDSQPTTDFRFTKRRHRVTILSRQ